MKVTLDKIILMTSTNTANMLNKNDVNFFFK